MQLPLQVTVRGLAHSAALETAIRQRADALERFYDRIMSCRVVVDLSARHKSQGKLFTVRIGLKVPGGEIAVTHEPNEDVHAALRDAFDAARRRLEDWAKERAEPARG